MESDWSIERVREVPAALLANLSDTARADMERYTVLQPALFSLSKEIYYVRCGGVPVLLAGAMQMGWFDPTRELWMYGSRHLRPVMARQLRSFFNTWRREQTASLFARCNAEDKARFLRFFGFRLVRTEGEIELYEVQPC